MRLSLIVLLAAALAACESPQTRVKHNQQSFDSYPSSTQELIRAGKVEVGFTTDQARMALGKPDRITLETTPGLTREVWSFGGGGSRVGVGFGLGMFSGGRSSIGTGVGVDSGGRGAGERLRLTFENGTLVKIWRRS